MQHHIDQKTYHIEILTPKQNSEKLDDDLAKFAEKYQAVLEGGYIACITDNPMGHLSFQATEVIAELGLPVKPEQIMVHLNTFHTLQHLHQILDTAAALGLKYLLVITGDGSERLPKLAPESIGEHTNSVTSVELMRYIAKRYPGAFSMGVAFNPYEPQDHELAKLQRKLEAGAEFVCTQPVIGHDPRVTAMRATCNLPLIIDAWMSKKLHLLSECVGYPIPENTPYDPVENLKTLQQVYPGCGLYLALLGFKTQFPSLRAWWV